jgi:hypothetical protein
MEPLLDLINLPKSLESAEKQTRINIESEVGKVMSIDALSADKDTIDLFDKPIFTDKNAAAAQDVPRKYHFLYNEVFPIIECSKFDDMGENLSWGPNLNADHKKALMRIVKDSCP